MGQTKEKNEILEWIKAIIIALIFFFIIKFFFVTPVAVSGESMMPTIEDGERLIVNKIGYKLGDLDRYDVIVFQDSDNKKLIKRVIGLPREHIAYKDKQLYVNGEPQKEPYLSNLNKYHNAGLTEDFTLEEYTNQDKIPEGYVFVLGDNRQNSKDSRMIGLIPMDEIIGTTNFVWWPWNEIGAIE
ncbi:signal peptidase I [Paraliobacillus sp. JSM ZJ581]|uniref:signal peptidase I n=1 Tax=Paraliobacillus sp. JSM ZJ581 TaxID=3342118 RepID=UPI0035A8A890